MSRYIFTTCHAQTRAESTEPNSHTEAGSGTADLTLKTKVQDVVSELMPVS